MIEAIYRDPSVDSIRDEQILTMAAKIAALPGAAIPVPFPNGLAMRLDVGGRAVWRVGLCRYSELARDFSSTDADLLGLIATLIAGTIDRSRQRARLRAMAYYDALTGLPNRVFLAEKLRDAIEVAQSRLGRVALLFLDLDRFKDVNDTLGHARGDRLLQMVAERLSDELGRVRHDRADGRRRIRRAAYRLPRRGSRARRLRTRDRADHRTVLPWMNTSNSFQPASASRSIPKTAATTKR